jgi:hypothetical protein
MSDIKHLYIASHCSRIGVESQMISSDSIYTIVESLQKYADMGIDGDSTVVELQLAIDTKMSHTYIIEFLNVAGVVVIRSCDNEFQACIINGKAIWRNATSLYDTYLVKNFRLWANVAYSQER